MAARTARQWAPDWSQIIHANAKRLGVPDHEPLVAVKTPPTMARPEIFGADRSLGAFNEEARAPCVSVTSVTRQTTARVRDGRIGSFSRWTGGLHDPGAPVSSTR